MGWSLGYDDKWRRDIGYGVPAYCDHPKCKEKIDRGLSYVCGGEPYGGEYGCGLYFCAKHLFLDVRAQACKQCRCRKDKKMPFTPKPEHPEWIEWKLTDKSWKEWREKNPDEVKTLSATHDKGGRG